MDFSRDEKPVEWALRTSRNGKGGGKENAFIVVEIWRENMSLVGASFLFEIQSRNTRFERERK